jgi:hypothetical protein
MKDIAISIPFGMSARNYLRSKFYEELVKLYNVTIISPFAQDNEFRAEFQRPNVQFIQMQYISPGFTRKLWEKIFIKASHVAFTYRNNITSFKFKYLIDLRTQSRKLVFPFLLGYLFRSITFFWDKIKNLYLNILYDDSINAILRKYDLLILTHPIVIDEIILYANTDKRKTKVIAVPHSWDNLSSKGEMLFNPENLVVWFPYQIDEVNKWYPHIHKITPIGVLQHDYYYNNTDILLSENEFRKRLNISEDKHILTYICIGLHKKYYFNDPYDELSVLTRLCKDFAKPEFDKYHLIIRLPAKNGKEIYRNALNFNHVTIDEPDVAFDANKIVKWERDIGKTYFLGSIMKHSDLIINIASTTTIDSLPFNKKVIWALFDGEKGDSCPYLFSIRKMRDFEHLEFLSKSGFVEIVYSYEKLIRAITDSANCNFKTENYEKVKNRYLPLHDGMAYQRLLDLIKKVAETN